MIGIGTDLVDIGRFRKVLERTPGIVDRLFTSAEKEYASQRSDPSERYAARFAAKEAALKALGLGLGAMSMSEIEVRRAESGEPSLVLHGSARETAEARGVDRWLLTLSHSDDLAVAVVVALGADVRSHAEPGRGPEGTAISAALEDRRDAAAISIREAIARTSPGSQSGSHAEQVEVLDVDDVARWIPRRPADAHKWQTALCLVAGSPGMAGAAALAAGGAQRSGAGYVRLCTPGGLSAGAPLEVVQVELPSSSWAVQVLHDLDRFSALVIGNGLGTAAGTQAQVRRVVGGATMPTVVDADGITALGTDAAVVIASRKATSETTVVLTPHDGEFARLAGRPPGADRIGAARALAARLGAVVLLKGSLTVVAHPDGRVLLSGTGDSRLATAGTGDVLAGVIGALCASGLDVWRAAAAGAFIHGLAGAVGWRIGLVASDLLSTIPPVLEELTERARAREN